MSQSVRVRSEARIPTASESDRAVLVDLQERRGSELFGFARHLGLSPDEANDAVQEALLRLWTALDEATPIAQPDAWTFRTLYRICMDQHRWRRRIRLMAGRLGPPAIPNTADATDAIAVWTAADQLPAGQRVALYLRYRADLPFEEIGAILGIQPGSARSQVSRALDSLRAALSEPEVNR